MSENFGTTFAMAVLLIAGIWSGIIFIIKTFPDLINEHVENNLISASEAHRKGTIIRKNISPKINKILSDLVIETEGDRAIIFEFSNGTSNLAGLPFLFVNATYEAISYRTISVAASYQRVNVSLIADFILDFPSGISSHEVQFTSTSIGNPTIYRWDFGDSEVSSEQNPKHTFVNAGSYTVKLTIFNAKNTEASKSVEACVVVRKPRLLFSDGNYNIIHSTPTNYIVTHN